MNGTIFDIKELAVHDGPGIRVTAFLKGCPLRCLWCHNPEGLSSTPQLMYRSARCLDCGECRRGCSHEDCRPFGRCLHVCPEGLLSVSGRSISAKELSDTLYSSLSLLGSAAGGVTFSGGEPLMQPEFLLETARMLKAQGVHLCIETSGYASAEVFSNMLELFDYVIMDIKLADENEHIRYTGVSNKPILQSLQLLKQSGRPFELRTPLIPNITDTPENLSAIERLVDGERWEKLPYNEMAGAKYKMLNMPFLMDNIKI